VAASAPAAPDHFGLTPEPVSTSEAIVPDKDFLLDDLSAVEPRGTANQSRVDPGDLLPPSEAIRLVDSVAPADLIPAWQEFPVLLEVHEELPELLLETLPEEPAAPSPVLLELLEEPMPPEPAPVVAECPPLSPPAAESGPPVPMAIEVPPPTVLPPAPPAIESPLPVLLAADVPAETQPSLPLTAEIPSRTPVFKPQPPVAEPALAPAAEPTVVPEALPVVEAPPLVEVAEEIARPTVESKKEPEDEGRVPRRPPERSFAPRRGYRRNHGWLILALGFILPLAIVIALVLAYMPKKKPDDDEAKGPPARNDLQIPPPEPIGNPFPNIAPPPQLGPAPIMPPQFPPNFPPPQIGMGPMPPVKIDPPRPPDPPTPKIPVKRDWVMIPATHYSDDGAHGIRPAPLTRDRVEYPLPARYTRFCLGGGGRYFLFIFRTEKKLGIFDLNEARLVKELPLADEETGVAAGLNHFFLLVPRERQVQRWSLASFTKLASVESPVADAQVFLTASAVDGPLLIQEKGPGSRQTSKARLYDARTLRPLAIRDFDQLQRFGTQDDVRVSGDGRVFTARDPKSTAQEFRAGLLDGDRLKLTVLESQTWHQIPDANGNRIFTGKGLFLNDGCPRSPSFDERFVGSIPATHGLFSIQVYMHNPHDREDELRLRWGEEETVLAALGGEKRDMTEGTHRYAGAGPVGRLQLVPAAKAIVFLPASSDRILLLKLDAAEALKKSKLDYLRIGNAPVTEAVRGTTYNYLPAAEAQSGPLRACLEAGPKGMAITEDGRLTWEVPADFTATEAPVRVVVGREGGKEVAREFRIAVR
jgi:hypothetical protein